MSTVDSWHLAALNKKQTMYCIGIREIHFDRIKDWAQSIKLDCKFLLFSVFMPIQAKDNQYHVIFSNC